VTAAVPARPRAAASSPAEKEARGLRRELDALTAELNEKRERLVLETLPLAGAAAAFEKYAPGSPRAAAAGAAAAAAWSRERDATAELALKAALLAEELQRYDRTGVLSPTPPATAARLELLLEKPWSLPPSEPEVAFLSLDLEEVQRQLLPYQPAVRPRPSLAFHPAPKPAESLTAAPVPAAPRPEPIAVRPLFERGRGRTPARVDPIPALIGLLSSAEPRERALAADELGGAGSAAAPAVPALRRALADPDRRVRSSAARALGFVDGDSAETRDDLRRAQSDPDADVRLSAQAAVRRLERP
jgi:hypothetical protein